VAQSGVVELSMGERIGTLNLWLMLDGGRGWCVIRESAGGREQMEARTWLCLAVRSRAISHDFKFTTLRRK
jgi:hypothetical protein